MSRYLTRSTVSKGDAVSSFSASENIGKQKRQGTVGDIFKRARGTSDVEPPQTPRNAKRQGKVPSQRKSVKKKQGATMAHIHHRAPPPKRRSQDRALEPTVTKISNESPSSEIPDLRQIVNIRLDRTMHPPSSHRPAPELVTDSANLHTVKYNYKSLHSSSENDFSIEQLEITSATSFVGDECFTCNSPQVSFIASVDECRIHMLILELSNGASKVCDLVLVQPDGCLLQRIRLCETKVIAFHAESLTMLRENPLLFSSHERSLEGVRIVYCTKKDVYVVDISNDAIQAIPKEGRKKQNVTQELKSYYVVKPSMYHEFSTCVEKNGARLLKHACALLLAMTDGSIFVFQLESKGFIPKYYTNVFQREYVGRIKKRDKVKIDEFCCQMRRIEHIDIRSCTMGNENTTFGVVADHLHAVALTVTYDGHVLWDHHESLKRNTDTMLPFNGIHNRERSLCFLQIGQNTLQIDRFSENSLKEEFSCHVTEPPKTAHAQTEDIALLKLTPWRNLSNILFRSNAKEIHTIVLSEDAKYQVKNREQKSLCRPRASSRITVQEAQGIVDSGIEEVFPILTDMPVFRSTEGSDSYLSVVRISAS